MTFLFVILFFISGVLLIMGLIKPTLFSRYFKKSVPTRKKLSTMFGGMALVSFIIVGITGDSTPKTATPSPELAISISSPTPQETTIPIPTDTTPTPSPIIKTYSVISVVDGDTIKVDIDGKTETLRLIGINTPETVDPRKEVQCFGQEASSKAKELLSGKNIQLENDSTQGERDKYNRLLRYVNFENGTSFNKLMISEGYAHEYTYDSNPYKYQSEFIKAEQEARNTNKGLWAPSTCGGNTANPTTTPNTAVATPKATSTPAQSNNTSTYYKNCTEVRAAGAAPIHAGQPGYGGHLDRDRDGIACE